MAIAAVIGAVAEATTSNPATTAAIDTTGCNLLVVVASTYHGGGGGVGTVTDNKSNTWIALTVRHSISNFRRVQIFYAKNPKVGTGHTFTLTPGGVGYPTLCVEGFSGVDTISPFDQETGAGSSGITTSLATGSITPTQDNELVIVGHCAENTNAASINSGFTIAQQKYIGAGESGMLAYKIQTTAAAVNPTVTLPAADYLSVAIASFKMRPEVTYPADSIDVPKSGVLFWHEGRSLVNVNGIADAGDISGVYDYSPNKLDLTCSSSKPTLDADAAGGKAAAVFSGTSNPLSGPSASAIVVKHLFAIAAYQDATFAVDFPGLISGEATGDILTSDVTGGIKFFNYADGRTYRKNGVTFVESNATAPMGNVLGILEVSNATGWSLDGVRLGQHKTFTARKWKGLWAMDLGYNRVLTTAERAAVYEYIAKIFFLWQQNSAAKNIWPFDPDWGRQMPRSKRVLSSVAVSGASKSRSKNTKKRSIDAKFSDREQAEFDAADRFWDAHYPSTSFIYRDNAKSPADDIELKFTSDLGEQSDDFNGVSYGWQGVEV